MSEKATILLLHGSKDASWMEPFIEMKDRVSAKIPDARIGIACLQFGSPTLNETVYQLFKEGIRKFTVVPVFIATRGHVTKDVPALVEKVRKLFPGAEITVTPAIGELPSVQQAMIDGIAGIAGK